MPGTLRMLVAAADPNDPDTIYGAGHKLDFVSEDEPWVRQLRNDGKAEILNYTPDEVQPTQAAAKEPSKEK
jgi:hypothetical protein